MRVLVIEDDEGIRANVLELLAAEGFEGEGAVDGEAGVAAALARAPDLVVCDVTMPKLDGYGVLDRLRKIPHLGGVPFVFLSARADAAAEQRRIEELAAFGDAETAPAPAVMDLSALRSEVAAVRADLGSLRAELGAVRADLDGLGGRLTGSVAASRAETGTVVRRMTELATRMDSVGSRVDEVRSGLPTLAREV